MSQPSSPTRSGRDSPPKESSSPSKIGGIFSRNNNNNNTNNNGVGITAATPLESKNALRIPQQQRISPDEKSILTGMNGLSIDKENSNPGTVSRLSSKDWEKINDPKVKRIVNVAQLYFFDYYFDLMTYIYNRRQRLNKANASISMVPADQQESQWKSYTGRERALLRKRRIKLKYGDFKILTQVGQGGYGQVYLAQKFDSREICALKVLNKKLLLKMDEIRHILTERDILTASKSPWLVKLLYSFQDAQNVYLAMEFVPGGDYRTLLNNTGILSPRHTRFYVSEMFASLGALHSLGYIHRDLKPENFLIDATGHIKLTDFGLASGVISKERVESMRIKLDQVKDLKVQYRSLNENQKLFKSMRNDNINFANSIVGSPDYMALDVLQGKDYNHTIDYWSLGCILFESLSGYPPFAGATPDETYSNLQQWKKALRRPQYEDGKYVFSDRTWDLIQRLITSARYRFNSHEQIKVHDYFAEVDWANLRENNPPFIPQLDNEADAGYFDDFSNEADMAKYKEVMDKRSQVESLSGDDDMPARAFIGFTFKHSKPQHVNVLEKSQRNGNSSNRGGLDSSFGTMF